MSRRTPNVVAERGVAYSMLLVVVVLGALAALAAAESDCRFVFTAASGGSTADGVALGEVVLFGADGGHPLSILLAENPGGAQRPWENAGHAVDGTSGTKWLDLGVLTVHNSTLSTGPFFVLANASYLELTLFPGQKAIAGYQMYTANDAPMRDPTAWDFQVRTLTLSLTLT